MTGLAPEIAAWLASNGLPDPVRIKTVPSASAAVMLLIDDHVPRWYGDGWSLFEHGAREGRVGRVNLAVLHGIGAWPHVRPEVARDRLEGFVARALARLG